MRKPKDNAEFFKLVSKLLYYTVSGQSHTGYFATGSWNKYYLAALEAKQQQKKMDVSKDGLNETDARKDDPEVYLSVLPPLTFRADQFMTA